MFSFCALNLGAAAALVCAILYEIIQLSALDDTCILNFIKIYFQWIFRKRWVACSPVSYYVDLIFKSSASIALRCDANWRCGYEILQNKTRSFRFRGLLLEHALSNVAQLTFVVSKCAKTAVFAFWLFWAHLRTKDSRVIAEFNWALNLILTVVFRERVSPFIDVVMVPT